MILAGWIVFLGLFAVLAWLALGRRRLPETIMPSPRDLARAHIANALLAQYVAEHPRRGALEREIQHLGIQAQLQSTGDAVRQYTDEIEAFLRLVRVDDGRADLSPRPLDALFQPLYAVLSSQQRVAVADELHERSAENAYSEWLDHFAEASRSATLSRKWGPYDPDADRRELERLKLRCDLLQTVALRMVQLHPHPRAAIDGVQWVAERAGEHNSTLTAQEIAGELGAWTGPVDELVKKDAGGSR